MRAHNLRVARRYVLNPGGMLNLVAHVGLLGLWRRYHAKGAARGRSCVIDVIPNAPILGRQPP